MASYIEPYPRPVGLHALTKRPTWPVGQPKGRRGEKKARDLQEDQVMEWNIVIS